MSIPDHLRQYRILAPLGKGGMGEVYAAEDTRLHRKVAIKVLSALASADPARRERFEREAQAIAAISHPNIVTIHAVEETDGVPFIVMELVEGKTLAEMIPSGGVPIDTLLRIGVSVSDAIAAAHERGITHRDLKPANVMVGNDGRVKVLDFGLAKLRESQADSDGETRLLPADDLTGEGRIIGTVAYMSPEQAEGKTVDSRSDIFSLGVMLHEMAVGERPFRGDTNVSVISSILKDTPEPITNINPAAPPELAKVVRRSLAKDPSRRYQTAIDLRNDLEELQQEIGAAATAVTSSRGVRQAPPRRSWRGLAAAVGVAIIVLAALIVGFLLWSSRSRAGTDFVADRFTRLTTTGTAQIAAMSGDGRYIVQVKADGPAQSLWVRQTAALSDVQIVPPAAVRYDGLAFSPDGNYVYYSAYALTGGFASLSRIPVLGGTPERVLDDIDSRITFSPDGRQFAFIRGVPGTGRNVVMITNADGGDARALPAPEGRTRLKLDAPAWSPDGSVIIAPAESLEEGVHGLCLAFDVRTGTSREVGGRWRSLSDMAWLPDGRSFIIAGSESATPWTQQLWQITYPAGERRRITVDLNNYVGVTLSNDGRSLATVQAEVSSTLWVAPASDPAKGVQITTGSGRGDGLLGLAWTGDGRLVFGSNASGSSQIWIVDADGQHPRQLTSVDGQASNPTTPAAGGFAVFQLFRNEGIHVSRVALDGSDNRQLTNGAGEFTPIVSPDGQWVYFNTFSAGTNQPEKIPAEGGSPVDIPAHGFQTFSVSPDGTRLLGTLWDAARQRSSLAIVSSAGGTPALLDLPVVNTPSWAPDGRSITYTDFVGGQMTLLERNLESGATRTLLTLGPDRLFGFAWSPDGQRIVLGRGVISSDVVLIARK